MNANARLMAGFAVAMLSGFIALSYEIVWVRVYGFLTETQPDAFGLLLGAYLSGLAFGAFFARRFCHRAEVETDSDPLYVLGLFLMLANLAGFCAVPLVAHAVSAWAWPSENTLPIFGVVAALLGTTFPLVSHYAIPADARAGARLSYLYVANILGSTAGSLTTGFILLDVLSLRSLSVALALMGLMVAGALILAAPGMLGLRVARGSALLAATVVVVVLAPRLYDRVYEKLQYQDDFTPDTRFLHVYEGKSGVVAVTRSGTVYGMGSYDGSFNTNPLPDQDTNRVLRAYLISALHPAPKHILMVGLGSGSWLQVLANFDAVETITAVEINPGYVEMMRRSPVVASALENPKVEIVIDDGRRYMRRTDRQFDVIIQNTIVYWRAHATNLLSREYFDLTRQRLKPGGLVYYNTTASTAAQKTGASMFPFAVRFQNMLIAGDSPIVVDRDRWRRSLAGWEIDGSPVVDVERDASQIEQMLQEAMWRGRPSWEGHASILERTHAEPLITDDNMATEWYAFDTYP